MLLILIAFINLIYGSSLIDVPQMQALDKSFFLGIIPFQFSKLPFEFLCFLNALNGLEFLSQHVNLPLLNSDMLPDLIVLLIVLSELIT